MAKNSACVMWTLRRTCTKTRRGSTSASAGTRSAHPCTGITRPTPGSTPGAVAALSPDYPVLNVVSEQADPTSMLMFYHTLLGLRRYTPALHAGSYRSLESPEGTFVYVREADGKQYLIALNFWNVGRALTLPGRGKVIFSTHMDRGDAVEELHLRANEGVVVELIG
ncbi:DUF3459 domain-containing protein [Candidatus Flexifilum breve]|uniref:DUF3459 domain-containing protein n=1 Tax=Candidatus Flexifilum breve TaxID=3140694 RepID=UPI0031CC6248